MEEREDKAAPGDVGQQDATEDASAAAGDEAPQADAAGAEADEAAGSEKPGDTTAAEAGVPYVTKHGRSVSLTAYDFRRPIQLSKGFYRSLSMVNETFAKLLTLSLSNYLHVPVTVTTKGVRQVVFEEHTESIDNPSFINILDLSPIKIPGMMDLDLALVFTMIEKLLGSHALANEIRREFTKIEMRIARKVVLRILTDLREAMLRILEVDVGLTSIEHNPDFTYIMNAHDLCIRLDLEIELDEFKGPMSICISLAGLDDEMASDGPSSYRDVRSPEDRKQDGQKINLILDSTQTELVAELGRRKITADELAALHEGSVFNLRKQAIAPLTVTVGNVPIFEGKMGRFNKKAAIKITRILRTKAQAMMGGSIPS